MSADKNDQDLSKKRGLLQRLQENYRRLKGYLALATHDIGELEKDRDAWAREGWVSRRARTRRLREQKAKRRHHEGFRSSSEEEAGQTATDLLDRKIASYRSRVRRTSVQLLVAAAAGYQYRETNLATRQGGLIKGIQSGIPRKYRAFDARPTPSLTSDEATARAVKNLMNRHKAGLDSDSDSDSDSNGDFGDGYRKSSGTLSDHNGNDDDDDDGGAIVKMAMAMLVRPTQTLPPSSGEKPGTLTEAFSRPYAPDAENPDIYNPRSWKWLHDIDVEWLMDDVTKEKFKNRPEYTPLGRMTWKQQEKVFPALDSVFKMRKKDESELWDPTTRVLEEKKLSERPPLEADINTLLSLERQRGFGRREMNPMYYEYSRVPLDLPAKLSDEEMRRGPLKAPPPLPLISNTGNRVKLTRVPTPPFEPDYRERRWNFLNMVDRTPLPIAQYHYPIDSPAVSTFKFSDGRQVSDVLQPGPLDEPRQVRGSQAIVDYGRETERQIVPLKEPYHLEQVSGQPPPGFRPEDLPGKTPDEKKEFMLWRKRREEEARKRLPRAIRREHAARRRAAMAKGRTPSSTEDRSIGKIWESLHSGANAEEEYIPLQNAGNPFWHFEGVNDSESHLHNEKKSGSG